MGKHVKITFDGMTLTQTQWARRMGINLTTLHNRLTRGWNIAEALTTPVIKNFICDHNLKTYNCIPRTCPPNAHPISRLMIREMRRQKVTWHMLAVRSGVGHYTLEGWRRKGLGTFANVEAACNALGIDLTAKTNLRKI